MTGKVAIVTGAAAGIGAAISARLLDDGYRVIAVDRDRIQAASHPERLDLQVDLADAGAAQWILTQIMERFGAVSVLINNAGIGGSRAVAETEDENWAAIIDINLSAAFRMSRTVLPQMIAARSGAIVHMTSIFGRIGYRGTAAYAASKAGIVGLTRQMAADYSADGVRVNAVAPGLIRTAMTERLMENDTYRDLMLRGTPMARPGEVEEVAAAVAFLVSDQASFICGEILTVDGGWSAARVTNDILPETDRRAENLR